MNKGLHVIKVGIVERVVRDNSPLVIVLVAIFILVFLIGAVTAPNFLTVFNFKTIIRDAAPSQPACLLATASKYRLCSQCASQP